MFKILVEEKQIGAPGIN